MKKIILAVLVFCAAVSVFGNNIYLASAGLDTTVLENSRPVRDIVRSIESGIMDVFFEEGHIISNFGLHHISEKEVVREGKNAGSAYILIVVPVFTAGDEYILTSISYTFMNTVSERVLTQGKLDTSGVYGEQEFYASCTDLGRRIAFSCIYAF